MDKDKEKIKKTSGGSGLGFGTEIILFLVVLFIIWILSGGSQKTNNEKVLLDQTNKEIPKTQNYGPVRN
jgi:hypothetical protein